MLNELVSLRAIFASGLIVGLALGAGLLGAYGRERHEGRRPDRSWWFTRACIMPFLAIVVSWAIDQWHLNRQQTALLAALLALSGYEAVRVILDRAQKKGEQMLDAVMPTATPKPYSSVIDTDQSGRPTAHVMLTDETKPQLGGVGQALRDQFAQAVSDTVPLELGEHLARLDGVPPVDGSKRDEV